MLCRLRHLFQKRLAEKRLDAELRFHLEQRVRDFTASGMAPEEARRRAHLAFGGLEQVKQDCRDARIENHVEDFLRDFQYALRSLAKDRRFALITVFALALGISATTVMFSVIYNVVFDPFPYRDFQRSVVFEVLSWMFFTRTEKAPAVSRAATSPPMASTFSPFRRFLVVFSLPMTASPVPHSYS